MKPSNPLPEPGWCYSRPLGPSPLVCRWCRLALTLTRGGFTRCNHCDRRCDTQNCAPCETAKGNT